MAHVQEIGTRVELVPMDTHFHDISVGLYQQNVEGQPAYLVHTYSIKPGAGDRLAFIRKAMRSLGGMVDTQSGLLAFPCGNPHLLACRRAFLEACKLEMGTDLEPRPLTVLDRKSGLDVRVDAKGNGVYGVASEGEADTKARRLAAIGNGLAKLGEMEPIDETTVRFPCGKDHNALLGLLLVRAPNVRAIIREEQALASRGVLAAPSQQSKT